MHSLAIGSMGVCLSSTSDLIRSLRRRLTQARHVIPERDKAISCFETCEERRLPLLGICFGMQSLNVSEVFAATGPVRSVPGALTKQAPVRSCIHASGSSRSPYLRPDRRSEGESQHASSGGQKVGTNLEWSRPHATELSSVQAAGATVLSWSQWL